MQNLQPESGYFMKFLKNYTALVNTGKTILLCWIPGHIGIRGNQQVDEVAKIAIHSSISAVNYPPSDLCHDVTAVCYKLWQADWDQSIGSKLRSVKEYHLNSAFFLFVSIWNQYEIANFSKVYQGSCMKFSPSIDITKGYIVLKFGENLPRF